MFPYDPSNPATAGYGLPPGALANLQQGQQLPAPPANTLMPGPGSYVQLPSGGLQPALDSLAPPPNASPFFGGGAFPGMPSQPDTNPFYAPAPGAYAQPEAGAAAPAGAEQPPPAGPLRGALAAQGGGARRFTPPPSPGEVQYGGGLGPYPAPYDKQLEDLQQQIASVPKSPFTNEQIAQRQAANTNDYQLGLLLSLSGDEGLQNVGGQILKQAMANRQPRITDQGMYDPVTGQYTMNQAAIQQQLYNRYESIQQRDAAARMQWSQMDQHQREQYMMARQHAVDQFQLAQMQAQMHADIMGMGLGMRREALQDRMSFRARDNYATAIKPFTDTVESAQNAQNIIRMHPPGTPLNAMESSVLAGQFARMQDPQTSGFGFNKIIEAEGLAGRIANIPNKLMTGAVLSPEQQRDVAHIIDVQTRYAQGRINDIGKLHYAAAQRMGLDPSDVFVDPRWAPRFDQSGSGGEQPGNTVDVGARSAPTQPQPRGPLSISAGGSQITSTPRGPSGNRQVSVQY